MPIPTPKQNETQKDFMIRCVSVTSKEFKDRKQAVAVCYNKYRESKK